MATIDELVAAHSKVPGDIKIRQNSWDSGEFFIPYFKDETYWFGMNELSTSDQWMITKDWELYTEPKKKIKLYKYAYRNSSKVWVETQYYFSEKPPTPAGYRDEPCIRVDHAMIEVEDE